MFGIGSKQASRVGTKAVKALISIHIVSVTLPRSTPVLDQAVLSVCFERGGKISSTTNVTYEKPSFVREVVVPFNEKVELMATLYKDIKTGRYQEKKGTIILREQTKQNRFGHDSYKGWGKCSVNLNELLNEFGFERTLTKEANWKFDLLNGSLLKVIVTTTIMSTGKDAETMSVASYATESSEFSTMAASFSHCTTGTHSKLTTANNTANNTVNTSSSYNSHGDEGNHADRGSQEWELDSRQSDPVEPVETVETVEPADLEVQASPRTLMSYLNPFSVAETPVPAISTHFDADCANNRRQDDPHVPADDAHFQNSKDDNHFSSGHKHADSHYNSYNNNDDDDDDDHQCESNGRPIPPPARTFPAQNNQSFVKDNSPAIFPTVSGSSTSATLTTCATNNSASLATSSAKSRLQNLLGRRKDTAGGSGSGGGGSASERSPRTEGMEGVDVTGSAGESGENEPFQCQDQQSSGRERGSSVSAGTSQSPLLPYQLTPRRANNNEAASPSSNSESSGAAPDVKKKGFLSRVMKPLKGSEKKSLVPPLRPREPDLSPLSSYDPMASPLPPDSVRSANSSESSKEAFGLYDQELRRRGDHVALLERRLAEQSAQMSAQTAALRRELASTEAALRRERVARSTLAEVTHKGDDKLAALLSEARDETAAASAEVEALRAEMYLLSGELQESRNNETRLRRGQDAEMHLAQEAAGVAATASVARAAVEEENQSLVERLIEVKMEHANLFMELDDVKRENSLLRKRLQAYAQRVALLEVKYAHTLKRVASTNSVDSD